MASSLPLWLISLKSRVVQAISLPNASSRMLYFQRIWPLPSLHSPISIRRIFRRLLRQTLFQFNHFWMQWVLWHFSSSAPLSPSKWTISSHQIFVKYLNMIQLILWRPNKNIPTCVLFFLMDYLLKDSSHPSITSKILSIRSIKTVSFKVDSLSPTHAILEKKHLFSI